MPAPSPGMDPYREPPECFPGLHDRLIDYRRATRLLRDKGLLPPPGP